MTDALKSSIAQLDDPTARSILAIYVTNQSNPPEPTPSPELQSALDEFLGDEPPEQISDGETARAALSLLADDPIAQPVLQTLISGPKPQRMDLGLAAEGALLVSAVLFALQTHIRFERDKEGRVSVKIEKKPTDSKLLKSLMTSLLRLLNKEA